MGNLRCLDNDTYVYYMNPELLYKMKNPVFLSTSWHISWNLGTKVHDRRP